MMLVFILEHTSLLRGLCQQDYKQCFVEQGNHHLKHSTADFPWNDLFMYILENLT